MISSAFTYGSSGMHHAYQGLAQTAQEVVSASAVQHQAKPDAAAAPANRVNPVPAGKDMNAALIGMKQQLHLFNASAKVVSTADQQLGSLLDTSV